MPAPPKIQAVVDALKSARDELSLDDGAFASVACALICQIVEGKISLDAPETP